MIVDLIILVAIVAVIVYAYIKLMTYKNPFTGKRERWDD